MLPGASNARSPEGLPSSVAAAINENKHTCSPDPAELEGGFITRRDVNGDGVRDYVLDDGHFVCGDSHNRFCGSDGCLTQVFVSSDGKFMKVLVGNVEDVRLLKLRGRPGIHIDLHGIACGLTKTAPCSGTQFWNGSTFSAAN